MASNGHVDGHVDGHAGEQAGNGARGIALEDAVKTHSWCRAVYWGSVVLGIGFGGVWIWAGVLKARAPALFLMDVRSFQMLGDPWAAWLALCLPWLEIFCGICVVIRRFYFGAMAILTGLLGIFLFAIISAQQRGLDITCGCFGKSENETHYAELITRDVGLLVVAFILMGAAFWLGTKAIPAKSPASPGAPV